MPVRKSVLILLILVPSFILSAEKKNVPKAKESAPKVTAVSPLAVTAGTTRITILGVKVDQARSILFGEADANATTQPANSVDDKVSGGGPTARIIDRDKVEVPRGMDAGEVGNTLLTVELVVPKNWPEGELPLLLVMADGTPLTFKLLVMKSATLVDEKESSIGFQEAQTVQSGQWIRGTVRSAGEVAVFRITGKKGQTLVAEVIAHRRRSLLDSLLTLYDANRNIVAENDDANDTDSLVRRVLPADGDYFLALTDATGHGGPGYPYLLSMTLNAEEP
jgi:hypothetical protein